MKAAIYCRISSDKTGEAAGVTRQLEDCRNLAATTGWTVVEEFIDNDISATSGKTRPQFERLLQSVSNKEVDAIICWHPDRLYRKLRDLERLIETVEGNHVAVKPVMAGEVDLSSASGRGIARILGVIASMEGEQKSERWRRSIRQRREQGQAPGWGHRLFGYARTGDIIQAEADAIRWAAGELIDGATLLSVARGLTERGHTSTRGNPWTVQALKKLMSNPRIAGHSTLNGDVVGVGHWEPILTPELFTQLQSALMIQRGTTGPRPRIALLAGLAHCALCEQPLMSARGVKPRSSGGPRPRIYRCVKQAGKPGCGGVSIQAEPLEQMVEDFAKDKLADPWVREGLQTIAAATGDNAAEIIALEERHTELEKSLATPGGAPVTAIMLAMDSTRRNIERLQQQAIIVPGAVLKGDWPEDLARRARLVRLAVADVKVGPALVRGRKTFQPERVKIVTR